MIKSSKLSTLGEFKNGLNYAKHVVKKPMKIIGIPDFGERIVPDYKTLAEVDESVVPSDYYLQNGDIVFVRSNGNRTLVGRTMIIEDIKEKIGYSGFCIRFRVTDTDIDPYYLLYYLKSPIVREQLSRTRQSNINNINQDLLGNLLIRLPKLSEQSDIAQIISNIDRKISLNNRINTELENIARLLYDYWFVQFDFPDAEGKPYRASGGEMVWCEELKREIPKGWRVEPLKGLLSPVVVTRKLLTTEYQDSGMTPIIDQSKEYIIGFTDCEDAIIKNQKGAIVFGDHTRILKYVSFNFARGADGTQVIISNTAQMPQLLLFYALQKFDLSSYGYSRHYKFLKEQLITLPSQRVADAFNFKVSVFQKRITHNIFENYELAALRDFLLPLLMNGQVRVERGGNGEQSKRYSV